MKQKLTLLFFMLCGFSAWAQLPGISKEKSTIRPSAEWDGSPRVLVVLKQFDGELYTAGIAKQVPEGLYTRLGINAAQYRIISFQLLAPLASRKQDYFKRVFMLRLEQLQSPWELVSTIARNENVAEVSPVPRIESYGVIVPNDYLGQQDNYDKVRAQQAWYKLSCRGIIPEKVTIAVVDNAVDLDHEDLTGIRWINEIENTGIAGVDDDGNGYVDDFYGWDMSDNDNNTDDGSICVNPHGTHVAGIAAAQTNNSSIGIASSNIAISPSTSSPLRIMAFKMTQDITTDCDTLDGVAGLMSVDYAIDKQVGVINLSWGMVDDPSYRAYITPFKALVSYAVAQNIVCVAAAGNDGLPHSTFYVPANMDEVIVVGSTDYADGKSTFSRYGQSLDIMAPGENVYSCDITSTSSYTVLSGTSMSAPLVAGFCGLIRAYFPDLTPAEVETAVRKGAVNIYWLTPNLSYWGLGWQWLGAGRLNMEATIDTLLKYNRTFKKEYALDCGTPEGEISVAGVTASFQWFLGSTSLGTGMPKTIANEGMHTVKIITPNPDPNVSQVGCTRYEDMMVYCDPCINNTDSPALYKQYVNELGSLQIYTQQVLTATSEVLMLATANNVDYSQKRHEKLLLIKVNARGKIIWQKIINPFLNRQNQPGQLWLKPAALLVDNDAFYIVSSIEQYMDANNTQLINSGLLIKTDLSGNIQWIKETGHYRPDGNGYRDVKPVAATLINKKIFIAELVVDSARLNTVNNQRYIIPSTSITRYDLLTATWLTQRVSSYDLYPATPTKFQPVDIISFYSGTNVRIAALMRHDYDQRSGVNALVVFDESLNLRKSTMITGNLDNDVLFFKKLKFDPGASSLILAGYVHPEASFHGILSRLSYNDAPGTFTASNVVFSKKYAHAIPPLVPISDTYPFTSILDIALGTDAAGNREYAVLGKTIAGVDYISEYGTLTNNDLLGYLRSGPLCTWKTDNTGTPTVSARRLNVSTQEQDNIFGPYYTQCQEFPGGSNGSDYMFLLGPTGLMRWKNQAAFDCSMALDVHESGFALVLSNLPLAYQTETVSSTDISGTTNTAALLWHCCSSQESYGSPAPDCNFDIPGLALDIQRNCITGTYAVRMAGTTSQPTVSSELYINDEGSQTWLQQTTSSFSGAAFAVPDTFISPRTINICLTVAFANGCSRTLCQDITVGHQVFRRTITRCEYPYTYNYVPQCGPTGNFEFTSSWGASSTVNTGVYILQPGTASFKWKDAAGCVVCEEIVKLNQNQHTVNQVDLELPENVTCLTLPVPMGNWPCPASLPYTLISTSGTLQSPGTSMMFTFCAHDGYQYEAIDGNGCKCIVVGTVQVFQPLVQHLATGAELEEEGGNMTFYPNPTHGHLQVHILQPAAVSHMVLYDMAGRVVMRYIDKNNGEIDLAGYASGQYTLVVVLQNGRLEHHKLVLLP